MGTSPFPDKNADLSRPAMVDTASAPWVPSPRAGVDRKPLDRIGGEMAARSTTVVRYGPGASFHAHGHPLGEEILVLEGIFSDEHGDYPAGTFFLNPPGFRHAPFSRQGCVILVKLCQYAGAGRDHVVVDTTTAAWQPGAAAGVASLPLYSHEDFPETIALLRLDAGVALPRATAPGGEEIFVLDGTLEDATRRYPAGSWLRDPPGAGRGLHSETGCTLYRKRNHLTAG